MTAHVVSRRGRFAPSPTGPLHLGSLVAALGSFLEARTRGHEWLVRMEDLDPPREQPGAADSILSDLERLGLTWDGSVLFQSTREDAYRAALAELAGQGFVYECSCSRREIAERSSGSTYPGTCRTGARRPDAPLAIRLRVEDVTVAFEDGLQGHYGQQLARDVGDFVLRRRDGLTAYQLAVVVDDAFQGITDVVRGIDLIDSTPRQIYLQRCLSVPTPGYMHLPIVVAAGGDKLSKQTGARRVDASRAGAALVEALAMLGQSPPPGLARAGAAEVLQWATERWDPSQLEGRRIAGSVPDEPQDDPP